MPYNGCMVQWLCVMLIPLHGIYQGYGSILAHVFFMYYNSNKSKYWNPLESVGICWNVTEICEFQQNTKESLGIHWNWTLHWNPDGIPMDSIPGGSWIPTNSTGFHWNFHGMESQNGWGSANWILSEFHGIPTFQPESSGFHHNSWRRVKTSILCTGPCELLGISKECIW